MSKRLLTVAVTDPLRLVDFVATRLQLPSEKAAELIRQGAVHVGARRTSDVEERISVGDRIKVMANDSPPLLPNWQVVAENNRIVVVDKPAGMLSQRSPNDVGGALDEQVQQRFADARLLHRLDRPVSGLVLFGRGQACAALQAALTSGRIRREYVAVVAGPMAGSGDIRLKIARHRSDDRLRQALPENAPAGESAHTQYRVLESGPHGALVELVLDTGRTHQIRVHLSALGLPIVGDTDYGGPPHTRVLLHARRLVLDDGQAFESPLPSGFAVR